MLLSRQLRKLGLSESAPPTADDWRAFLDRVRRTYQQADQDRYTLERSLSVVSREMQELHDGLRRSEERHRVLFESSPVSLLLFDPESFRILAANDACIALYGYTREELLSLRLTDLKIAEDKPDLYQKFEAARRDPTWRQTSPRGEGSKSTSARMAPYSRFPSPPIPSRSTVGRQCWSRGST